MKRYSKMLCILFSFVMISGCSLQQLATMENKPQTQQTSISEQIELAMQAGNIKYNTIDHFEIVDEGVLAFYEYESALYACYITQSSNGWSFGGSVGSVSLKPQSERTTVGSVTPHKVYYRYGVITDARIEQILIDGEQAKIVKASNGTKFWFLANKRDLSSYVTLQFLSKEGKVLYEDNR